MGGVGVIVETGGSRGLAEGEDRGGANVIEGQTGLPASGTEQKCCTVIHG